MVSQLKSQKIHILRGSDSGRGGNGLEGESGGAPSVKNPSTIENIRHPIHPSPKSDPPIIHWWIRWIKSTQKMHSWKHQIYIMHKLNKADIVTQSWRVPVYKERMGRIVGKEGGASQG